MKNVNVSIETCLACMADAIIKAQEKEIIEMKASIKRLQAGN